MKFTYIPLLCTSLFLSGCSLPQEKIDAYKANIKTQKEKLQTLQKERLLQENNLQLIEALLTLRTKELEYALQPSKESAQDFDLVTDTLLQKFEQLQKEIRKQKAPVTDSSLSSFEKSIYEYKKAFQELAGDSEKLGYDGTSGAQAELRIAAHKLMSEIEKSTELRDDFKVRYYVLELRKAEKDLLLHKEQHYFTKVKKRSTELLDVIQQEGYNKEYDIMARIIAQYDNATEQFMTLTNSNNADKKKLRQAYITVGSALSDLRQQIQKDSLLLDYDKSSVR